ncbi:DUF6531 domain-containing protein [Sorangium sp. So ce1153]|uniref:DUF6531 domain-containing protein n=1 Tax=Sorangium sp. So ce1153 TaxID=3133333 RepID=UPI003F5FFD63
MIAAKWGDPVLGIDIHMVMVPTPAGPVPTPLPHPFIGVVFDPMGAAMSAVMGAVFGGGGAVRVNGMPVGNTGTEVKGVPHFPTPPGVSFAPNDIPGNDGTLITGSKTVDFEGSSQSRTTSIVMSCNFPINLPTSVCLAVPMGAPVVIGGPEAVDFAAAATQAIRTKWVSNKLHALTGATKGSWRSKVICFLTGHPVDVMTGELIAEAVDFELPGMIPIVWERNYRSRQTDEGTLGAGWSHPFEESVEETASGVVLRLADGRPKEHPPLRVGASDWDGEDRYTLTRTDGGYEKRGADGLRAVYTKPAGSRRFVLSRLVDRSGNAVVLKYERGFLREVVDTAGRVLEVRWTREGRMEGVYFEGEPLVRYSFDAEGRLSAATDPLGHALRYEYRGGVMVKETRKGGLSFHFAWNWYHPEGWCVRTWGDGGIYDRRITYDEHRHFTSVEDGRGGITQYWGNALGLVDRMVDPMGAVTEYAWDAYCRKTSETDGLGNWSAWEYDARGNCVLHRDPLGHETRMEYDREDQLVRLVDAAGGEWAAAYDARGKPVWARNPAGAVTWYAHDEQGRLAGLDDSAGRRARMRWTSRHDLAEMTDGEARTTRFEHDARGRLVKVVDAGGRVSRAARDKLGRITHLERADGERLSMARDAEGNVVEEVDALGRRVVMRYAGMNRLVEHTDPMKYTVRLHYDKEEDLVAVENQHGEQYRFELDRAGRVEAEIGFDGRRHRYLYDKAGRTLRVLGPDYSVTQIERDALGRITRRTLSAPLGGDAPLEETFAYSALGELVEARSGDVNVVLERDGVGQVVRERREVGEARYEVESRYNDAGLRVERQTDLGHRAEYAWNKAGELAGVRAGPSSRLLSPAIVSLKLPLLEMSDWEMRIERDPLGLELARRLPGGVVAAWKRDAFGRPALQHVLTGAKASSAGTDVMRVGYQWEGPEQIAALIDTQKGATRFTHDPRGHLIAALFPDGTTQHRQSDAVSNLFRSADRKDRVYGRGGVLLRAGGTEYRHDGAGNLIEKRLADGSRWTYRWDPAGRLREVERPDGKRVAFAYDALGRRVRKEFDGAATEYVWDGDDLVHERVRRADGTLEPLVTWIFEPGAFAPVAKFEGRKRYSVVIDHLGTTAMLMTEAGQVAWKAQLDLYGVPREELAAKATECPWRYPGQYEDAETGLYYNRFRYYDPECGRYISQDPVRLNGGVAQYGYVKDVLAWLDPLGLTSCSDVARKLAARISSKVKVYGKCFEFAARLQKSLQNKGISGSLIEIQVPPRMLVYSDAVGRLGDIGQPHRAIRVGDMVFDNLRPQGISYQEFIKDLGGDLLFGKPGVGITETVF